MPAPARYVIAESWDHLFPGDRVPREARFAFDREENRVASLQVKREDGWEAASDDDVEDVEDSLLEANADVIDGGRAYGLTEADELPEWAQAAPAPRP